MGEKIAILLATYNGGKYIKTQLDSILSQTYENWELLISDDGSNDDTQKIISDYTEKYPDKIKIFAKEKPTGNAKRNFMFLTKLAKGYRYIMYCDQDDYWLPEKIELTYKKMKEIETQSNMPCLVHSDLEVVDGELNTLSHSFFEFSNLSYKRDRLNNLLIQNIVTGCTVMINEALLKMAVKDIDVEQILMHDWYFALIASAFGRVGFVNKALIKYRQHGNNSVGAKNTNDKDYIIEKINQKDENKKSIRNTMQQALVFEAAFESILTDKQRKLLSEYGSIQGYGKLKAVMMFLRLKTWKNGILRKIAQIIYV